MARRAGGWTLFKKREHYYVRFSFRGRQYRIALHTQESGEAATRAAKAYSEIVSGRRAPLARRASALDLPTLYASWVEALAPMYSPEMSELRDVHGRTLISFFDTLDAITPASIGDYQRARLQQVMRATLRKELSSLRLFLQWLVEQGALERAPDFPVLTTRHPGTRSGTQRHAPVIATAEQVAQILAELPETVWAPKIRATLLVRPRFEFAWETGLRPATLARISVPDSWRPGDRVLRIHATGDKTRNARTVPLSDRAVELLEQFAPADGLIFGEHDLRAQLKRAAMAVLGPRLGKLFAPYDFRHSRATHLIELGAPKLGVAELLGHRDLRTTDHYTHPSFRAAVLALEISSPISAPGVRPIRHGTPKIPSAKGGT